MRTQKNRDENKKNTTLDKKKKKIPVLYIFTVIILVIIVVTFLGSPVAGNLAGGVRITFGKYANIPIEFYPGNYLSEQKDILAQELERGENQNFELQMYQVWRGAFDRTIIHTALLRIAEKNSVKVSNNKIDTIIVDSGLYSVNGEFSIERYNETPRSERSNYRKYMEESLTKNAILDDYVSNIKVSKNETEFIAEMGKPEISLDIAYISFESYPDSEVTAFVEKNKNLFRSMEASRITITSNKNDADKIYEIVSANPNTFSDTAKNQSKDSYAESGGDMGDIFVYNINMELKNRDDIDKIFSLETDTISPVIETNSGWAIYKCTTPATDIDLADSISMNTAKRYMSTYESGTIEDYFMQKANTIKADTFTRDAFAEDFSIYTTALFPINFAETSFFSRYLFKSISFDDKSAPQQLKMLNYNEDFLISAFSLKEKEITSPIVLSDSIIICSLAEKADNNSFQATLDSYYPYLLQQINDQNLASYILDSDKLTDNFDSVFAKEFR